MLYVVIILLNFKLSIKTQLPRPPTRTPRQRDTRRTCEEQDDRAPPTVPQEALH